MSAVPEQVMKDLEGKKFKIVIGIPSYNNADTIGYVAEVAAKGVDEYFDGAGIVVNSDGGSKDGTKESFMTADTRSIEKLSFEYIGVPGKGSAMKSIFEIADVVDAQVIVFLDSDLRSVKPWWVERLAKPIVDGDVDYVAPYYIRHKYDATITNHICYPLTSSLYGLKIRQPIGGDFGVGRKVYKIYLEKPEEIWKSNVAKFGIDIWMTTTAVNESGRVGQAALGAKVHDVKDPGKHLGPMFLQVVSTLFNLMEEYEKVWMKVDSMETAPIYGEMPKVELEEIKVDLENLKNKASKGAYDGRIETEFLSSSIVEYVIKNGELDMERWIETVFSFALAYKKAKSDSIVEAMIPYYFARIANFVENTKKLSTEEAEKVVEEQVQAFFDSKNLLIKMWG